MGLDVVEGSMASEMVNISRISRMVAIKEGTSQRSDS